MAFSISYHAAATAPIIVAPALADADVVWTRPDLTTTATKTPLAAFFNVTGVYSVTISDWSQVTQIVFIQSAPRNWLTSIGVAPFLNSGALQTFDARNNTNWNDDISGWVLPASLVNLFVEGTNVLGDLSGWILPASLVNFDACDTAISGDIGGWVLPASLVDLRVCLTSVSGDISGWTLPAVLETLQAYSTAVSGDISGWTLPAPLANFYVFSTSVSGDISGYAWPASLTNFGVESTSITYGVGGFLSGAGNFDVIRAQNCGLTQAMVDAALVDTDVSGASNGTLNLGGTNAAPSAVGLAAKANLIARGWTVTTN